MATDKTGRVSFLSCCLFGDRTARHQNESKKKQPQPSLSSASSVLNVKKQVAKLRSFRGRVRISDLSNPDSLPAGSCGLHVFTLAELRFITRGFSGSNFLGEGGFGPVHKGFVDDKLRPGVLKAQPVAVKLLDLDGLQGHREWLVRIQPYYGLKIKVFVFSSKGHGASLQWSTRMKIALGAAKGLQFLHDSQKPVIYRDFKASNILLDSDYTAKLSDFGLAKDGPEGPESHVSTRVMGTPGYAAPEYIMTGHLTSRSDVYSFGVVLLELLTGRRSVDKARPQREQNLVAWARPILSSPRRMSRIMDPRLDGQYSETGARKAATLAYRCLSLRPRHRPKMSYVVRTLEPLKDYKDFAMDTFIYEAQN
ncbi:unnamed protein product [Linum tenue]|uniref:Protein kinase domain-containing protein n=1 Tax=Linum tenue TaxID=586396 RepID=A0AAV0KG04_9ROSI|nr:unnamed protein product [Linum tenue]